MKMCKLVNIITLAVNEGTEFCTPKTAGNFEFVEIPEHLIADSEYLKAERGGDGVIMLSLDTEVKNNGVKNKQIKELSDTTWNTILNQAKTVYGLDSIDNRAEAGALILANHSTWLDMVTNPSAYVGDLFIDEDAVLSYAQPKLMASSAFGKWRMQIMAEEQAQKDAILSG